VSKNRIRSSNINMENTLHRKSVKSILEDMFKFGETTCMQFW